MAFPPKSKKANPFAKGKASGKAPPFAKGKASAKKPTAFTPGFKKGGMVKDC